MYLIGRISIFCLLIFCLITQNNNCLANETNEKKGGKGKTYGMYIVPGKLNANSIFHIFLISKDGGEFGAWDLQFSNNDNLYELHGFKEDTNYFLLVVSFGDDVVISPNLIHFFKLTNGKKIVRSIPLDDDHQENRYRKPVKRYAI